MEYTLNYVKTENGYVGHLMEMPSVVTQAKSLDELKINIKDALKCILIVLNEEREKQPTMLGWDTAEKIKIEL